MFRASGRTIRFEGFLKVNQGPAVAELEAAEDEAEVEEKSSRLPQIAEGDLLELRELKPEEHKSSPPPCYNEASLIRAMEKHGIGRPSTYANILRTIIERAYVEEKKRKLHATELGLSVTDFLVRNFTGNFIDLD